MSRFADLPVVSWSLTGYDRLFCFPRGWPMWEENGKFYALGFDKRPGGTFTASTEVVKEEIPADVYHGATA